MMKALIASFCLMAAFAWVPSFAGDIQEIIASKCLRVAMISRELPPFICTDPDGKLAGYDYEIAKRIAEELKVELKVDRNAATFDELVDKVEKGEADIALSKLSRTLERSKKVVFSDPYLVLRKTLIVNRLDLARRRKAEPVQDYIKHLDANVGVIGGSSYAEFAKSMFPKAKLREYPEWNSIMADVMSGKILCGFRDEFEVKRAMRAIPSASIELMSIVMNDADDSIAIAISADKMQFRYWINELIEERNLKTNVDKLIALDADLAARSKAAPRKAPPAPAEETQKDK